MSSSKSGTPSEDTAAHRTRVLLYHGTRGTPTSGAHDTLLDALTDLMAKSPNVEIAHIPGVGTHSGRIGNLAASGLGSRAVKETIITSVQNLADNYNPTDEIIIIAYSRGSYTARSFVGFLNRVGLPSNNDRHVLRLLVQEYTKGRFLENRTSLVLKKKYQCRDVRIKALICIDTVGSLGLPHTGIFRVFEFLRSRGTRHAFMEINSSSNVENMFHALALHETRGPFEPTLMHISRNNTRQVLKQVWFPGSHGDIARESENGCIADGVLAWVIANIEEATSIEFDEVKLEVRFPRMNEQKSEDDPDIDDYVNDSIQRSNKGIWLLMGRLRRVPGSWHRNGMETNEMIHITARRRGHGRLPQSPAVAGYTCKEMNGKFSWERNSDRRCRIKPFNREGPKVIEEAPFSPREAQLLGAKPQ